MVMVPIVERHELPRPTDLTPITAGLEAIPTLPTHSLRARPRPRAGSGIRIRCPGTQLPHAFHCASVGRQTPKARRVSLADPTPRQNLINLKYRCVELTAPRNLDTRTFLEVQQYQCQR